MTVLLAILGIVFYPVLKKPLNWLSLSLDRIVIDLDSYIKKNGQVITILGVIALAAYGFELFNLNLTIDEELYAFFSGSSILWIGEGRWGMYLLNKFLLPYPVIPAIPLFLALVFHILAVLIILNCWEINSKLEQVVAGAMMFTFPTLAYIYMFSTLSYGIGIGFFCVALSLFLYVKNQRYWRWLMVVPISFSIAIYQAFALVLAGVFIVYLIIEIRKGNQIWRSVLNMALMFMGAFLIYYLIQRLWMWRLLSLLGEAEKSAFLDRILYTQRYFDFASLQDHAYRVFSRTWSNLVDYYSGVHLDYAIEIRVLGFVMIASIVGLIINLMNYKSSIVNKALVLLLSIALLGLPFLGVVFSNGRVLTRTLLALPVSIAGIVILGLLERPRILRISILTIALFCIFQFSVSTNRLFGASHLALQADRLVAVRLMEKIDEAKAETGIQNPTYLEIVGKLVRDETLAIPWRTTIGLSFFELPTIGQPRIASFLEISGYQTLRSLPSSRLAEFVEIANAMPAWPAEGSVQIVGDTVLIKFGDYPVAYKREICDASSRDITLPQDFCP